jgi:hypothetical protein
VDVDRDRFVALVLRNGTNREILERGAELGLKDWWLTGGAVFQTVWNAAAGREPDAGIRDYDLFYFDAPDLTGAAERAIQARAASLLGDLAPSVEVSNEARVHLWYEGHFGVPAARFTSTRDAIDHFISPICCFGLTMSRAGTIDVYAPHGYGDLFAGRIRPNQRLAPREVYERKTARWCAEWPHLQVESWPDAGPAPHTVTPSV